MPEKDLNHQALEFATRYRDRVRYVTEWERWLKWDGMRWVIDQKNGLSLHLAAELCRDWGFKDTSNERPNALRCRAEGMDGIRTSFLELDTHDTLLNTRSGVVDQLTGHIRPHDPGLLITQITACEVGSSFDCPTWRQFMEQYCCGDAALRNYRLGLIGGEWMFGGNRPQKLWFDRGPGGSGKSTFNHSLAAILGDYAIECPGSLIEARDHDPHQTELASLYGKRLLVMSELERNRSMAVSKVKRVTGDATIRARRMREDEWEFRCSLSPVVCCNDLPSVDNWGKAEDRRFEVLPAFASPEKPDYGLMDALIAEGPGILAVLIQTGIRWRQEAWPAPKSVVVESEYYRDANEAIGSFFRCCCETGGEARSRPLHEAYCSHRAALGLQALSEPAFAEKLKYSWGYKKVRKAAGSYWQGLTLLPADQWRSLEEEE